MKNFEIKWIISPEIPGGYSTGIKYKIPPTSLKTSTVYIISVAMTHLEHTSISDIESTVLMTQEPPSKGLVEITPEKAMIGDQLTASVSAWVSSNGNVVWALWQTKDGQTKDKQVTSDFLPMSRSQEFYVNSVQPYLFEIKDLNGEIAREYLTLDIGVAP